MNRKGHYIITYRLPNELGSRQASFSASSVADAQAQLKHRHPTSEFLASHQEAMPRTAWDA